MEIQRSNTRIGFLYTKNLVCQREDAITESFVCVVHDDATRRQWKHDVNEAHDYFWK